MSKNTSPSLEEVVEDPHLTTRIRINTRWDALLTWGTERHDFDHEAERSPRQLHGV